MGLIADTLGFRARNVTPIPLPAMQTSAFMQPQGNYLQLARAYSGNEIVYAAIELLASSAGEPHICGRRWRRNSPTVRNPRAAIRNEKRILSAKGVQAVNATLVKNGYVEELPDHPLVEMCNAPNPFMSRGQFWGTAVMDRCLAGNFYALKVRSSVLPNSFPLELWRLRPDRVRIIPSQTNYIEGYEYRTGTETIVFPAKDVLHWKTRNPLNDYYGMPPLMPILGRLDIDWYMQSFLRNFFESGGTGPGAVLTVKTRMSEADKDDLRARKSRLFSGKTGEWLILDNTESSYQQLGLNRGLRDALPKELDAVSEARIAMIFGIPGSILGLLIGYESSSYANKRQDWQVLWDVTMTPLLSDLDDVLNLSLAPEFNGIDEVYFDLDDIKALQEDVDKVQERERKNFQAGGISFEEFRDAIGRDPEISEGLFYVPSNLKVIPFESLGEEPEPTPAPAPMPEEEMPDEGEMPMAAQLVIAEPRCPNCGRRNGANIQAGGSLTCARCREDFVVALDNGNGTTK